MKKLSALEAIRKFCLQCQGGVSANVTECQHTACPFYAYRLGVALPAGKHRPLKTIRTYCVEECQAGNQGLVEGPRGHRHRWLLPCLPVSYGQKPEYYGRNESKTPSRQFQANGSG